MQIEQDLNDLRSGAVISFSLENNSRRLVTTICVLKAGLHQPNFTPSTAHGGGR